jgi:outer membrane protein assembly factor BamB
MRTQTLICRLALAVGLSVVVLVVAVVIQATLLFPEHIQALRDPFEASVRQFVLTAEKERAIALLRHSPKVLPNQPEFTLHRYELAENSYPSHRIDVGFAPWIVAGAGAGERIFVGSREGDIYCFDPRGPATRPRLLGRHPEGSPLILECTHDGSTVIAGDLGCISAWDGETATCLWQRSDIRVAGAHFHVTTSRLYCGLVEGPCVELDRRTGTTLRTFGAHGGSAISLDVSADGKYLATLGFHGQIVVIDLEMGTELWSRRFPMPTAAPRFTPDGKCLLTAAPGRAPALNVLSAATGELLAELQGAKQEQAGIEVTTSGLVYAWDKTGTLTVWDLTTRTLLRQTVIPCSPAATDSI